MCGASFFDMMATYSMTVAFQSGSGGFVSLFTYLGVVYAFAADQLFFHEEFERLELIVAVTIIAVAILVAYQKFKIETQNKTG